MELTTIVLILIWLGIRIGLGLFFKKADIAFWKAFVPVLSTLSWLKLIKKPKWWLLLSFVPVVNIVLGIGMIVELLNCFQRRNPVEHVLGSILGFIYLPYLALTKDIEYVGPVNYNKLGKGRVREWSEAIFFAVIAATIIRTFTIEAFQIPTSSMEGTLLRGDFLFVSKVHYGAKTPKTPLAFPFMHHSMPVLEIPAYLDWIELPSFRFPALQDIERNDIVVFNYPREDYRPIDKREHYIKRCVGVAGDELAVVDGRLTINGKPEKLAKTGQMSYSFTTKDPKSYGDWLHEMDLNEAECGCYPTHQRAYYRCQVFGNERVINKLKNEHFVEGELFDGKIRPWLIKNEMAGGIFPNYKSPGRMDSSKWTRDFYGPIWIPKEGEKIELATESYKTYKRVFTAYEKANIVSSNDLLEKYTFLKSLQTKEITNGDWEKQNTLAFQIQDVHSFVPLSKEMNKWADGYFMRNFVKTEFNENQQKIKKAFTAIFNSYKKNELKLELDSIEKVFIENNIDPSKPNSKSFFLVDGQVKNEYTFQQDYFFMMGDNRHNSGDSRAWGFVPHDHVVGKAVFVWLSTDPDEGGFPGGIRWHRLCSFVSSEGLSRSFLWEFLIGGTLLYFANKWWKKKKTAKKELES